MSKFQITFGIASATRSRSEKYVNSVSVCEKRLFNKLNEIFKVTFQ